MISVSEPQPAVIALYLRDVAGLPTGTGIPPLSPPVSIRESEASVNVDEACAEWNMWWDELMRREDQRLPGTAPSTDETFPEPSRFPVLAELASRVQEDALEYSTARKREAAALRRENILNRVLFQLMREARPALLKGRRAREVSLHVTQIPVDGEFKQSRSQHHLVVSVNTYKNSNAYDAALRETLGWR